MTPKSSLPNKIELQQAWQRYFGASPPNRISLKTLELAYLHNQQSRIHGGLNAETKKRLYKIAIGDIQATSSLASRQAKSGARLVRHWHDQTYIVDILDNGYLWKGEVYSLLSKIARIITGTKWSGPRFFGVKP